MESEMSETNMKYYSVGDGCAMPVYEVERVIINKRIIEQDKTNEARNEERLAEWKRKKLDREYYSFFKKLRDSSCA